MKGKLLLMWDYFKQILQLIKEEIVLFIQVIIIFTAPIHMLLMVVGLAVVVDLIFGLLKMRELKEKFTSRKLSQTVSKLILYSFGVVFSFIIDKYLLGEFVLSLTDIPFVITKIVTTFIVLIEVKSVHENILEGWGIDLYSIFKGMLARVKEVKEDITDFGKKG